MQTLLEITTHAPSEGAEGRANEQPTGTRNPARYTGVGVAVGTGIGTAIGVATGNLGVWLSVGIAVRVSVGVALSKKAGRVGGS